MPKLPQVSGKEAVKALQKVGFIFVSQEGSHIKLSRALPSGKQTVIVPAHKILKKGTLRNGILKPINLSVEVSQNCSNINLCLPIKETFYSHY